MDRKTLVEMLLDASDRLDALIPKVDDASDEVRRLVYMGVSSASPEFARAHDRCRMLEEELGALLGDLYLMERSLMADSREELTEEIYVDDYEILSDEPYIPDVPDEVLKLT